MVCRGICFTFHRGHSSNWTMAAAAVGVSELLASAFTSSLGSTVVTYDQYENEKKKDDAYFEPLDIDQLFQVKS